MKRVGNDHEELHNAKLAPSGYYNGFHHKDYEGNYSQKKSHARHHRGHRLQRNNMVQLGDHDLDTDDFPDEETYVNYEHEDDTEDISELVDNKFNEFVQINPVNQGLLYLDTQISEKYEHEDDTDSIPEGHAGQVIGDGMNLGKKRVTLKDMISQRMDQNLLQVADHTDDTDSIPEGHAGQVIGDGTNLVQRSQSLLQTEDHFNDTEDVPLEQEATQMRGTALRRMHADEAWDNFYAEGARSLAAESDLKEEQWDKANQIPEMP